MLKILIALLLFTSQLAAAQTTDLVSGCWPKTFWTPTASGSDWKIGDTTVEHLSDDRTEFIVTTVSRWAWWCPEANGTWKPYVIRCVLGRTCVDASLISQQLDTAARSGSPLQSPGEMLARFERQVLKTELPAWQKAWQDAIVDIASIKPPDIAYVVAVATRADGTRPAYEFLGGVRGTKEVGRATAGQPCAPGVGYAPATGTNLWSVFGPSNDPARVTLCAKKP